MAIVKMSLNDAEVRRQLRRLGRDLRGKAVSRALNRTVTGVRTEASRVVRDTLNLKAKDFRKDFSVRRARPQQPVAQVVVAARAAPLSRFGARQTRRGVSVKVRRSGARIRFRHAFMVKFRSGRLGVVERQGNSRLPIEQLYSTAPVQLLDDDAIVGKLGKGARDRYGREIQREVAFRLRGR